LGDCSAGAIGAVGDGATDDDEAAAESCLLRVTDRYRRPNPFNTTNTIVITSVRIVPFEEFDPSNSASITQVSI
jgi:hypothetical protein